MARLEGEGWVKEGVGEGMAGFSGGVCTPPERNLLPP